MKYNALLTATVLLIPVEAQAQALDFVGPLLPDAGVVTTPDAGIPASVPDAGIPASMPPLHNQVEEKLDDTLRRVEELEFLLRQHLKAD
jgi:hypothetical protein